MAKPKLGHAFRSRWSNRYLRKLALSWARACGAVSPQAAHRPAILRMWAKKLIEKKPFRKACLAVALANKMTRIAFAIMRGKTVYREIPA